MTEIDYVGIQPVKMSTETRRNLKLYSKNKLDLIRWPKSKMLVEYDLLIPNNIDKVIKLLTKPIAIQVMFLNSF